MDVEVTPLIAESALREIEFLRSENHHQVINHLHQLHLPSSFTLYCQWINPFTSQDEHSLLPQIDQDPFNAPRTGWLC